MCGFEGVPLSTWGVEGPDDDGENGYEDGTALRNLIR
jgi:hypothetical protein